MKKPSTLEEKKNEMLERINWAIQESIITEENIKSILASSWAEYSLLEESYDELIKVLEEHEIALSAFSNLPEKLGNESMLDFLNLLSEHENKAAETILGGMKAQKSVRARKNVNIRHDKPGGSREKQKKIREIWASGKFSSRDLCTEQECAALDMSYSSARKALRNTPKP